MTVISAIFIVIGICFVQNNAKCVEPDKETPCGKIPNSTFMVGVSSTQPTCENPEPKVLRADYRSMCVCNKGFVLDQMMECIPPETCPNQICARTPNSSFKQGVSSTQPTCENPEPTIVTFDLHDMCVCNEGYVINQMRQCVLLKDCPKCEDANSEYAGCASPTRLTCQNPKPPPFMAAMCSSRCECKNGFMYDETTEKCVLINEC